MYAFISVLYVYALYTFCRIFPRRYCLTVANALLPNVYVASRKATQENSWQMFYVNWTPRNTKRQHCVRVRVCIVCIYMYIRIYNSLRIHAQYMLSCCCRSQLLLIWLYRYTHTYIHSHTHEVCFGLYSEN